MECDCFIGYFSGEDIRISTIGRQVQSTVSLQPELKRYGILNGEPMTAPQLVDGRRGYLHRFCYCPYCGNKIDWKNILKNFK